VYRKKISFLKKRNIFMLNGQTERKNPIHL